MFLFFFCRNLYGPHICLWGFFTFLVDLAHGAEEGEGIALSQVTPYIITSVSTPFALRPVHVLWTWSIPNLSKHDLTEQVDYILLSLELTIYPSPLQHLPHTSNKIFTKQTHQDFSNPLLCRLDRQTSCEVPMLHVLHWGQIRFTWSPIQPLCFHEIFLKPFL